MHIKCEISGILDTSEDLHVQVHIIFTSQQRVAAQAQLVNPIRAFDFLLILSWFPTNPCECFSL